MSDLSLFDIESGLHELMTAWQEAETPEAVESAETAIRLYAEAEVRKVDGVRRYIKNCDAQAMAAKAEMNYQAQRVRAWEARRDRLKAFVFDVMKSFELKKLEGQTGALSIRVNGGVQPLVIEDVSQLPSGYFDIQVARIPAKDKIRAALEHGEEVSGCHLEPRGESLVVK